MCRRLFCFNLLLVLTTATFAQMGQMGSRPGMTTDVPMPPDTKNSIDLSSKQRILLSNYCRLDYEGARLRPDGWKRFRPYTSTSANPDYRTLVIVTRFSVETPAQLAELVYVNYQDVGYYDERRGYVASATSERVEFQVEENNNEVLVVKASTEMPHVSPRAAIAWMNQRLANPKTSDMDRSHLRDAVEQLNKLLLQPLLTAPAQGK
jgi:hypothetical protein